MPLFLKASKARGELTPTTGKCTVGIEICVAMLKVGASHPGDIYGLGIYPRVISTACAGLEAYISMFRPFLTLEAAQKDDRSPPAAVFPI